MPIKEFRRIFRALANETRLRILAALLAGRAKHVTRLAAELDIKQSTVSHNLKRLLDCGLISVRQRGHFHYYSANKAALSPLFRALARSEAAPPTPVEAGGDATVPRREAAGA